VAALHELVKRSYKVNNGSIQVLFTVTWSAVFTEINNCYDSSLES